MAPPVCCSVAGLPVLRGLGCGSSPTRGRSRRCALSGLCSCWLLMIRAAGGGRRLRICILTPVLASVKRCTERTSVAQGASRQAPAVRLLNRGRPRSPRAYSGMVERCHPAHTIGAGHSISPYERQVVAAGALGAERPALSACKTTGLVRGWSVRDSMIHPAARLARRRRGIGLGLINREIRRVAQRIVLRVKRP